MDIRKIIPAVIIAVLGAGCGGGSVKPDKPLWVADDFSGLKSEFVSNWDEHLHGIGTAGGKKSDSSIKRWADINALNEINSQISISLRNAIKNVESTVMNYSRAEVAEGGVGSFISL